MNNTDPRNLPEIPFEVKLNGPIEAATAPLLGDEELTAIAKRHPEVNGDTSTAYEAGDEIRDWYEAKIASGELMVVKTVKWSDCKWYRGPERGSSWYKMACCQYRNKSLEPTPCCPGCGAKIIEG